MHKTYGGSLHFPLNNNKVDVIKKINNKMEQQCGILYFFWLLIGYYMFIPCLYFYYENY